MNHQTRILLAALLMCALHSVAQSVNNNFTIDFSISDEKTGMLMMKNLTNPNKIDTIRIVDSTAKYLGNANEPTPFLVADDANKYQLFFAAPGEKINITLRKKDMVVTFLGGSPSHDIFRQLITVQEPLQQIGAKLQQAYSNPSLNSDSLNKVMEKLNQKLKDNFYAFLDKNKSSEVAAFVIYSAINNDRNIKTSIADSMYNMLIGPAKTGFYGTEMNRMLSKLRAVEVGYMAPDFTLADSTGNKKHTLSAYRGKYVLVDFWASWCGPCKAEIPHLKNAYSKYHQKGFEIISVSLDDKKEKWTAALRQLQMPWIHVSDVKGFASLVNELYHVPSIPKTLLLDKTGKIIATDLRGESLSMTLEQILGK